MCYAMVIPCSVTGEYTSKHTSTCTKLSCLSTASWYFVFKVVTCKSFIVQTNPWIVHSWCCYLFCKSLGLVYRYTLWSVQMRDGFLLHMKATPEIIHFNGIFHEINHPFWATSRKPPGISSPPSLTECCKCDWEVLKDPEASWRLWLCGDDMLW